MTRLVTSPPTPAQRAEIAQAIRVVRNFAIYVGRQEIAVVLGFLDDELLRLEREHGRNEA